MECLNGARTGDRSDRITEALSLPTHSTCFVRIRDLITCSHMVIKMLFDPAHCYVTARLMLMELFILMGPFYDFMNSEFISIANIIHCLFLEY